MHPDWLNYIDRKRRVNLIQILQCLSQLQDKRTLNFIVIGALPLLVSGYLTYKVYWDIDLLFRDNNGIKKFMEKPKPKMLRIVEYDDALMVSKNITSFHTAWAFNRTWFNVDYIVRKAFFEFYTHDIDQLMSYKGSITVDHTNFKMCLYMAHPWDIIVEKVISPRTARDVELQIDTSIDLRHIFAVYTSEKTNLEFWHYIFEKTKSLCSEHDFKAKFLKIISSATELGYSDLEISSDSIKLLQG